MMKIMTKEQVEDLAATLQIPLNAQELEKLFEHIADDLQEGRGPKEIRAMYGDSTDPNADEVRLRIEAAKVHAALSKRPTLTRIILLSVIAVLLWIQPVDEAIGTAVSLLFGPLAPLMAIALGTFFDELLITGTALVKLYHYFKYLS